MRLYRTAALAELLHDKSPEFVHLTARRRQRIDLKIARQLDMPYLELGHAYLRLIRKQDIQLMHSLWGVRASIKPCDSYIGTGGVIP